MRLTYRPVTKSKDLRPMGTSGHLDPGGQTGVIASARAPRLGARRTHLIGAAVAVVMVAGGPATALLTSAAAPSPSVTPAASAATDNWSQLLPTTAPLPRDSAEVAYDTSTSTVVISGGEAGCGPRGREVYEDTWTWDGKAWKEVATNAPPVFGAPAAYDGATQTFDILWYQGCADGPTTSEWNGESWGSGGEGTAQTAQTMFPDNDGAMAYDASTQTIVLWSPSAPLAPNGTSAPSSGSTTWSWDGTTWNELSPSISPPPSVGDSQDVQMVYDQATSQILLYGDHSQAMWAWNGTQWSELSGSGGPSPRVGSSMVYDPALREALLFGGDTVTANSSASASQAEPYTLGAPLNDLWAWNGSAWQQLHPAMSPPARFYAQMAYDGDDGQVVLFGGAVNDNADIADTWVYGPAS
jgi:hypothetical protein